MKLARTSIANKMDYQTIWLIEVTDYGQGSDIARQSDSLMHC